MPAPFDEHAACYNRGLATAVSGSGETREYFASGRVAYLAKRLRKLEVQPHLVLDFGCGDGSTAPILLETLGAKNVLGVDPAAGLIDEARASYAATGISYVTLAAFKPAANIDVAYCNGVFRHIPLAERDQAVGIVRDALRPGGLFSLWENNPWNPATRYVMSRCESDDDAIMLNPSEARGLLAKNGFEIVRTDYRFIFPRALRILRPIENLVYRAPLGTQYQVLAQKI